MLLLFSNGLNLKSIRMDFEHWTAVGVKYLVFLWLTMLMFFNHIKFKIGPAIFLNSPLLRLLLSVYI